MVVCRPIVFAYIENAFWCAMRLHEELPVISDSLKNSENAVVSQKSVAPEAPARIDPVEPDSALVIPKNQEQIPFRHPLSARLLGGILFLATFFTLHEARDFFLPIVMAVVLNLLLSPVVRNLKRIHIPTSVGAALVLAGLLLVAIVAMATLLEPAAKWYARAPRTLAEFEERMSSFIKPISNIKRATEKVAALATGESADEMASRPVQTGPATEILASALNLTWRTMASLAITVVLLYFLLSAGDFLLNKVVRLAPQLKDKKRAVEISRDMEHQISRYLIYITLINGGLGTCVGLLLWMLGMPNPSLWGAMAFVFNFIPYLGGSLGIAVVAVVAAFSFETLGWAVLAPLAYFVCFFVEGNFVTPSLLGRGLRLNPVVIFIWLTLWVWMWGIFGALLAMPMLVILKILADHLEPLTPLREVLAE